MSWRRTIGYALLLLLLVGLLPVLGMAQEKDAATGVNKIEGELVERFSTERTADFIVRFVAQADLSAAYGMDWEARGEYVYNALQEVAERSQAQAKAYLDSQGLEYHTFVAGNDLYVWAGDLEAANALAALPEVAFIRATRVYQIPEPVQQPDATIVWGILDTAADDFWSAFGMQGDGIVVANIDTGVDYTHDALEPNYKCGSAGPHGNCWLDPGSQDCTGPGGGPCDTVYAGIYHGTHTMGTMAADDDAGLLYTVGMAPNAQWIACLGCPFGGCPDFDLNSCADWMLAPGGSTDNRPHVVNNSWGGGGCNTFYLAKVQAWRAAGIFPAFSAGNMGSGCSSLGSPGDYQESFGSAAHDSSRTIASFSSRGPSCYGHDPYTKPNLSAPGVDVISARPGDTWDTISGTSMASPHSAGAVALLWSCNPSLIGQMDQTFEALQDNTDVAPAGNCGAPPDGEGNYTYGYGYLNVYNVGLLWCGDLGYLDGHVYDDSTGLPIYLAEVVAVPTLAGESGIEAVTDPTGYYTMPLMVGMYDVTASHGLYTAATATGVEILVGQTTTQDFDLVPRGRLFGYVTDYDSGLPLEGMVEADDGTVAYTDPATGYYEMYLDEGTHDVTASAADHADATATVVIVSGEDTQQDFALMAAVAFVPSPVEVTLDWQTMDTLPATLLNRMDVPYDFEFLEEPGGFIPMLEAEATQVTIPAGPAEAPAGTAVANGPYSPRPMMVVDVLPPSTLLAAPNVLLVCSDYQPLCEPIRAQLQAYGDLGVVDVFDAQVGTPALGDLLPYDVVLTWSNYVYANPTGMGDVLADYVDAGGRAIDLMFSMGTHGWQMGGRFMAENYTAINGTSIIYGLSCLGTYDPTHPIMEGVTNVCDTYRLNGTYMTAGSHEVARWADGQLFVAAKDDRTVVSITGYVGGAALWTGQMDDVVHNAILWLAIPGDVPWLGEDPIAGTVPPSGTLDAPGTLDVTLLFSATFDAGVDQPGDYYATLVVDGDPKLEVPVTMTVLPPADMGKVHGYVLDRCTGEGVEAVVDIAGGDPVTQTMTDPDTGYYAVWLVAGSYDFTFSAGGYLDYDTTVDVTAGQTVTVDVDLFPDRPCIAVEPDMFEVWLVSGTVEYMHPTGMDITNNGAQDLEFEITEMDGGYAPTFAGHGEWLYRAEEGVMLPTNGGGEALAYPSAYRWHGWRPDQPNILIYADDYYHPAPNTYLDRALQALGYSYTAHYDGDFTGFLSSLGLGGWDLVLFGDDNYSGSSAFTPLNDYLVAGGRLIINTWVMSSDPGNPLWASIGVTYLSNDTEPPNPVYWWDPGHPIFNNPEAVPELTSLTGGRYGTYGQFVNQIDGVGTALAGYTTPGPDPNQGALILNDANASIFKGFMDGQNDANLDGDAYPDGVELWIDMIEWLLNPTAGDVPWIWEDPVSGTVPADVEGTVNVDIYFTALYTDLTPMPLGTYSATLKVRNNDPVAGTPEVLAVMHIVPTYVAPTATFTSNSPVCLGEPMVFTNTTTPGIPPKAGEQVRPETTYLWDFGDGQTSVEVSPTHLYADAGTYVVVLEACNLAGLCDTYEETVEVLPLPEAGFTYEVDVLEVSFTNTSVEALSYEWDFGDGMTSTEENPVHTYADAGTYTVVLTAINSCGEDVYSADVEVLGLYYLYLPIVIRD